MKGDNATSGFLRRCARGLVYLLVFSVALIQGWAASVTIQVDNVGTQTWGGCSSGAVTRNGAIENYLPVMAPGAVYTYSAGNWTGTYTWRAGWGVCGSVTVAGTGNAVTPDLTQPTVTVYLRIWPGLASDPGGSGPQWNFKRCYQNNSGVVQDYQVLFGTNVQETVTLPPGASYCLTYRGTEKVEITFRAVQKVYREDGTLYRTDYRSIDVATTGDSDWFQDNQTEPPIDIKPDGGFVAPDLVSADGTNILYGAGSGDLAKDSTLKTAANSLYGLNQQGFQNMVDQLRANQAGISSVQTAVSGGFTTANANLTAINATMGGVNTRLDTANNHLSSIKQSLINIDGDGDGVNTKLSLVDGRLLSMQGQLTTNNNSLGSVNSTLASINSNLTNQLGPANASLDSLELKGDTANTHLAGIKASAQAIESTAGVISSKVENKANEIITADNNNTTAIIGQLQTGNGHGGMMTNQLGQIYWLVDGMRIYASNTVNRLEQVRDKVGDVVSAVVTNNPSGLLGDIKSELVVHRSFHAVGSNIWTSLLNVHTNTSGIDSNAFWTLGDTSAVGPKQTLDDMRAGLGGILDEVALPGGADLSVFNVTIGGVTTSLNPFNIPGVVDLAAWMRQLILWAAAFLYLLACWRVTEGLVVASASARQASSAATLPGVSSASALAMAGAITLALAAIPAVFAVSIYGSASLTGILGANPLGTANPAIATGVWVLDQFVPLVALFTYGIGYLLFRLQASAIYVAATTIVRFMVG